MDSAKTTSTITPSPSKPDEIERDHLAFALHYGQRYGHRLCRFYGRVSGLLRLGEIVMGTAAFGAFLAGHPGMTAYSGLAMAIISGINITFDPAAKAKDAAISQADFGRALIDVEGLPTTELRRRVRDLQAQPRPELESLRRPVWRDVVLQLGRPAPMEKFGPLECVMNAIA